MIINERSGRTSRILAYAVGAARQGRELAIIVNSTEDAKKLHKLLLQEAEKAGCRWVVGDGVNGGTNGNIEIYPVSHAMVREDGPGNYEIRGSNRNDSREVLVDHSVYESRFGAVVKNYVRWL